MTKAAKSDSFHFSDMAARMDKLTEQVEARKASENPSNDEVLGSDSLRRQTLAMFFVYLSMTFLYYVAVPSAGPIPKLFIPHGVSRLWRARQCTS
ncbi:hypothetical protein MRX96_042489 [Rhipicephalus microplus]